MTRLHFELQTFPDIELVKKGGVIASLIIPGGAHANPGLAINELEQYVSSIARSQLKLPPFLADNVQVVQLLPSIDEMNKQLASGKRELRDDRVCGARHLSAHRRHPARGNADAGEVTILGVDPGTRKVGFAVVDGEGETRDLGIEVIDDFGARVQGLVTQWAFTAIAIGTGTNARALGRDLAGLGIPRHLRG